MSTLPPHDVPAIFWIDGAGQQQGPEPLATVIERIAHEQIPSSTPVWWQGAANWSPFNTTPELASALDARLAPVPAPAPEVAAPYVETAAPYVETASPFAPAGSPFSNPAPSESASPFSSPAAFDAPGPSSFETPAAFAAPVESSPVFEAPITSDAPVAAVYDAPAANPFEAPAAVYDAPATMAYDSPVSADVSPAYDTAAYQTPAEATAVYETPIALDDPAPAPIVSDIPEIIVPDEPAAASLQLGDPAELEATFSRLTERSGEFEAEVARAATLDTTLAAVVRQALGELGFTIEDTQTSDDYHSFRLSEPDGATASLAIQRVPAALTVDAAVERPLACFVDRVDRASVGLFFGDYLDDDGATDQALFTRHLASVVDAAGR